MISCLICASSILFVAETFYRHNDLLHGKASAQDLRDDAETCLKVFEALSTISAAAQKAAEILGGLSRICRPAEEGKYNWLMQDLLIAYLYLPSAQRCQETSFLPRSPPFCSLRTHRTVSKLPPTPWDQPTLPHHHVYLPTFHFLANGPVKHQLLWNGFCDFSISRASHQPISLAWKMGKLNNSTILIYDRFRQRNTKNRRCIIIVFIPIITEYFKVPLGMNMHTSWLLLEIAKKENLRLSPPAEEKKKQTKLKFFYNQKTTSDIPAPSYWCLGRVSRQARNDISNKVVNWKLFVRRGWI